MHAAQPPLGGAAVARPTSAPAPSGLPRTGRLNQPRVARIRKRRDFLAANSGVRVATPSFILLVKPGASGEPRAGFTVSKKVGNAVARNRAKRRLREVARLALGEAAIDGADHVFIARAQPAEAPFSTLLADAESAVQKARRKLAASA